MLNQNVKGDRNKSIHFNSSALNNAKDSNSNKKILKNNSQVNPRMLQSRINSSQFHNSPIMHKTNSGVYMETNNLASIKKFE